VAKRVIDDPAALPARSAGNTGLRSRYSELPTGEWEAAVRFCRELTEEIYDGMDLSAEIRSVASRREKGNKAVTFTCR
jgi:hypothetical protein